MYFGFESIMRQKGKLDEVAVDMHVLERETPEDGEVGVSVVGFGGVVCDGQKEVACREGVLCGIFWW